MCIAELARLKSSDPRLKVGCCLVNSQTRQVVSLGYNGLIQGFENLDENWKRENKTHFLQHAETNALSFATSLDNFNERISVYVTCLPCAKCALLLIQKRFPLIIYNVFAEKYKNPSMKYFKDSGIDVACLAHIEKQDKMYLCFMEALNSVEFEKEEDGVSNVPKRLISSWDQLYMSIATLAEKRCAQETEKSGCCITRENQILSFGYTGPPQSMLHKTSSKPDENTLIDALQNALCFSNDIKGSTIYCSTIPDRTAIIQACQRGASLLFYRKRPETKSLDSQIWITARKKGLLIHEWDENKFTLYHTPIWLPLGTGTDTIYGKRLEGEKLSQTETDSSVLSNISKHNKQSPAAYLEEKRKSLSFKTP